MTATTTPPPTRAPDLRPLDTRQFWDIVNAYVFAPANESEPQAKAILDYVEKWHRDQLSQSVSVPEWTRYLIRELLSSLPTKRDWLSPDVESGFRELLASPAAPLPQPQADAEVTRLDIMGMIRAQCHRCYASAIDREEIDSKYMQEIDDALRAFAVSARLARTAAPSEPVLIEVLRTLQNFPGLEDESTPFGEMIAQALDGKVPALLGTIECLAHGVKPPEAAPSEIARLEDALRRAETKHLNLKLDLMRIARGDDTVCDFKEIEAVKARIAGLEKAWEDALQAPAPLEAQPIPTDLSKRLREMDEFSAQDFALLKQAADEIDRYYGGMLNWKKTAETKDRKLSEEIAGRINDRIAARPTDQEMWDAAITECGSTQIGRFTGLAFEMPEDFAGAVRAALAAKGGA